MGPLHRERTPLLKSSGSTESSFADVAEAAEPGGRGYLFLFLIALRVLVHFDSGAVASGLGSGCTHGGSHNCAGDQDMLADLGLSYAEAGLMACLVYLGLSVACTGGGFLLEHYRSKWVLAAALAVQLLCIIVFAASGNKSVSLASRFVVGLAQAFLVMYMPVWVDEYAPPGRATSWLALTQVGSNLGIILGYVVAGLATAHTRYSWRAPFWFQVALLVPVILLFLSLSPEPMEISDRRSGTATAGVAAGPLGAVLAAVAEFPSVLAQPLFALSAGVLSVLYFVVAGMQVWITPFLTQPPFSERLETIVFMYSAVATSAPALGLVVGGLMLDRIGGYQDAGHAVNLALGFCVVGVGAAWLAMWCTVLPLLAVCVWVLLFCGGVVIPACVGLGLAAVEKPLRPTASSLSLLIVNLFGWFAGPLVSGSVASVLGDVRWGFWTTMIWSSMSFVFLILMRCIVVYRQLPPLKDPEACPAPA